MDPVDLLIAQLANQGVELITRWVVHYRRNLDLLDILQYTQKQTTEAFVLKVDVRLCIDSDTGVCHKESNI